MNAKEHFQRNKDLAKWWVSVTHDPRFADVLTNAISMFMECAPDRMETGGARSFLNILETIGEANAVTSEFPTPGIIHNVEKMPAKLPDEEPPQKPPEPQPDPTIKRSKKR